MSDSQRILDPAVAGRVAFEGGGPRRSARSRAHAGAISIGREDGVAALERFSHELDRLNAASARPSPFSSAAYLRCYALHNEYFPPGAGECLFVAREAERVVGCVPMRRRLERWARPLGALGKGAVRFEFLALHDNEQPRLLCAPEDEERVAAALVAHLCHAERGWGMVELVGQLPGGALHRSAHAAADERFRVRDIRVEPYSEIALTWPDLGGYFRSLTKHMRSNVSRQARRLYAAGAVELLMARGAEAAAAWFDAYCDLDDRSWKAGTTSSIRRDERRVLFFRELLAGRAGIDPSFFGVVLDGALLAGLIVGADAAVRPGPRGAWCLEMAYDRSRSDLGPGQLLLLLAVGDAIERGRAFLNLMQSFGYYKHRWAAEPIDVVNVQVIRRRSLHNVRATAGEIRRTWPGGGRVATGGFAGSEPRKPLAETHRPPDAGASSASRERARGLTAAALREAGAGLRRLDPGQAAAYLPFPLGAKDP